MSFGHFHSKWFGVNGPLEAEPRASAEFIVAPRGIHTVVCGYTVSPATLFGATKTGRPAPETIE